MISNGSKLNAIITGAYGFIGKHLALRLQSSGWNIIGIGHGSWTSDDASTWGIDYWLNGDLNAQNLNELKQRFPQQPQAIFHLAGGASVGQAISDPKEDFIRTVSTTLELLDWMRINAFSSKLIVVSSAAVYGSGHSGLINEDAPLTPYSIYGHNKYIMEQLCRAYSENYGLNITVARLFSVYGKELRKQLMWDICRKLKNNPPRLILGGTGKELRDWISVENVAKALEMLLVPPSKPMNVFNVGTGNATTVAQIAKTFCRIWAEEIGADTNIPVKFSGESRIGDPFSLIADIKRMKNIGYIPKNDLEIGITNYIKWFLSLESESF